jgi:hypothetical protein
MTSILLSRRAAFVVLPLLALSGSCYAQSPPDDASKAITTDRPDVTEASVVVPKGSLQIENRATWTSDHGSQTFDLSESLIRLGLSARTEFRVVVPNYLRGIGGADAHGFGDIALGMKQQIGRCQGALTSR